MVKSEPSVAAVHAESFAAYRRRIEGLLAALAAFRGVPVDTRLGALGLSALMDGLWLELCLDPSSFTPDEAVTLALNWVAGFMAPSPTSRLA